MATFSRFNSFVEAIAEKAHNLGSDTLKVMLTNTAPTSSNAAYSDISATEVASGGGYTTGGTAASISSSAQTSGTYKLVLGNVTFTGSGGGFGPFRYVVLYNSTAGLLIGYWDYGSSITTVASGETFTVQFDGTTGVLQIA